MAPTQLHARPETLTRREVLTRALYVTPAILTLRALPAHARRGSVAPSRSFPRPARKPNGHY